MDYIAQSQKALLLKEINFILDELIQENLENIVFRFPGTICFMETLNLLLSLSIDVLEISDSHGNIVCLLYLDHLGSGQKGTHFSL